MTLEDARKKVNARIAQIERENPVGILQPWDREACPAATEHWGMVQQRIALARGNPQGRACCADQNLSAPERSTAQKAVAAANRVRLTARMTA